MPDAAPLAGLTIEHFRSRDRRRRYAVTLDYRYDATSGRTIGYEVTLVREEPIGGGNTRCTVLTAVCCRSRVWAEQEARRLREEGTDAD